MYFFFILMALTIFSQTLHSSTLECASYSASPGIENVSRLHQDIEQVANKIQQIQSSWSANPLSPEQCQYFFNEIKRKKINETFIPELLSVIDIIKAECGASTDPIIVVKKAKPFSIEDTNFYFEWNKNNKLIMEIKNLDKYLDYINIYSLNEVKNGVSLPEKDMISLHLNKKPAELMSESNREKNIEKWWSSSKNGISKIMNDGQLDIYIPMLAYHDRNTYEPDKIKQLNEAALGLGVGKSLVNSKGNSEKLFVMAHLDSHSEVEINAGYAWQKNITINKDLKIGLGYAAGFISREDLANRVPIPFILPMAGIKYGKNVSIDGVLIPKLNGGINNGNVLFIFSRYTFDKQK